MSLKGITGDDGDDDDDDDDDDDIDEFPDVRMCINIYSTLLDTVAFSG